MDKDKIKSFSYPPIPHKKYFSIGEVATLCDVKPHVLRYWETEFSCLKPVTKMSNHRRYMEDDIVLIRQIKNLLYDQGYTIEGVRRKLNSEKPNEKKAAFLENTFEKSAFSEKKLNEIKLKLKEILDDIQLKKNKS